MHAYFLKPEYASTVNTTNTASAGPTLTSPFGANRLRLVSTVDVWVAFGTSPVAVIGAGVFLPAKVAETFLVARGDQVAAINDTAATGKLNVTEMQG